MRSVLIRSTVGPNRVHRLICDPRRSIRCHSCRWYACTFFATEAAMLERRRKTGKDCPEILTPFIFEVQYPMDIVVFALVGSSLEFADSNVQHLLP